MIIIKISINMAYTISNLDSILFFIIFLEREHVHTCTHTRAGGWAKGEGEGENLK